MVKSPKIFNSLQSNITIFGKDDETLTAKLSEIEAIDGDEDSKEALADWQYWLARGYKF
ncbi:MAG: calcium-binding protein [Cuspidothrix sp.]|uniref:calcium-binding protein n=1 Tax=Cuspidothrix issatschenkoi TaxID=230752 RepID=UPI001FAEEDB1|nr:calcium-binding protein [Cuspidothrix issatschenkoi]